MSSLGIYFGPRLISIVETKGRKIVNNDQILQSTISSGELEEKVPTDVKIVEIIALFKDELRRKKIEAKEATLCLSGKDLIIRTFEIPILPKQELQSAINFEAKKYIPFKVEELISDFQIKFDRQSRSNLALFMGIKKETLNRYISVLSQLNLKINAIEYSGFSVLRCLKLTGASDSGVIGILGTDLTGEDEVNFTVLEHGFPLFSRDISLGGGPEDLIKAGELNGAGALEKLNKEIKVSLDYWHRKFPTKSLKKIYFFSSTDFHAELEAYIKDIGLGVQFINIAKYIDKSFPYSLSFVKAYSASLYKTIKTNLKLNLLAAKEKTRIVIEKPVKSEILNLLKWLKLDNRVIAAALLICGATYGFGMYQSRPLVRELTNAILARAKVTTVNPDAAYEELTNKESEYKSNLGILEGLVKKQLYIAEPLRAVPKVLPRGAWLAHLDFKKTDDGKSMIELEGFAYAGEGNKEFEMVNQFVSNLRENSEFVKYFTLIDIKSLDRRETQKVTATNFFITCKNYRE